MKTQNLIGSFKKDHNALQPGVYRASVNRNIITFDLRVVKPNTVPMSPAVMHSVEHLLATYFKTVSVHKKDIVSLCPGGCRTNFYLEVFDSFKGSLYTLLINAINWCLKQESVPGSHKIQCGNYKSHNLCGAKKLLLSYRSFITKEQCIKATT